MLINIPIQFLINNTANTTASIDFEVTCFAQGYIGMYFFFFSNKYSNLRLTSWIFTLNILEINTFYSERAHNKCVCVLEEGCGIDTHPESFDLI